MAFPSFIKFTMTMMLRSVLLLQVAATCAFAPLGVTTTRRNDNVAFSTALKMSSDWSDFSALDDDDDFAPIDRTDYAKEEDSQEAKAAVGATRPTPTIERDAEPIYMPQGK
jgi:hypothetical protein